MASKTLSFLPKIFQTDTNEKFVSATLDQLLSEPDLKKVYGYIGRKFAPTYTTTDSYIEESTSERQQYQLEPSIVINSSASDITFYASYMDLLNKIKFYGGLTNNHNRLFENEYYSFDPLIDYDKFVNFSQYYWLPDGPESVDVATSGVEFTKTYDIVRNDKTKTYEFSTAGVLNPTIILARGGTYTFNINQTGFKFWIQSELGLHGRLAKTPTVSSRDVLGVLNNGDDTGSVTFTVPLVSAQNRYIEMPVKYFADVSTSLKYSDIQYKLLSQVISTGSGLDGMSSQLDGKTLIFVNQDKIVNDNFDAVANPYEVDFAWTTIGAFSIEDWATDGWDTDAMDVWDRAQFLSGVTVPDNERVSLWTIKLTPISNTLHFSGNITATKGMRIVQQSTGASAIVVQSVTNSTSVRVHYENAQIFAIGSGTIRINNVSKTVYPIASPNNDYIIKLTNADSSQKVRTIQLNEKVYVKTGITNASKEFYKDYDSLLKEVPLLSSLQEVLFYQDGSSADIYGEIQVVDINKWAINIPTTILNKKNYTSPNGVTFTNGLKIKFGLDVMPTSYQNKEFYIEGVGTAITLTEVSLLVTPEEYHTTLVNAFGDKIFPDYVVINRSSMDLNPWSRNNRWFHRDILTLTNKYNHPTQPVLYDQSLRAVRPIIEFEPNIKLVDTGIVGKNSIDILDNTTVDAFNFVQGQPISHAYGIPLVSGLRIIFAIDNDPLVRNTIYIINLISPQTDNVSGNPIGSPIINLVKAVDGDVAEYDTVVATQGYNKGTSWWFNGVGWAPSQQKVMLHQSPYFDVFDSNGISYTTYPKAELVSSSGNSKFAGTQIFGYKVSTAGVSDPVLGFPLSYRNFSTQGEIEFQNYFDTETIQYEPNILVPVNNAVLHQADTRYTYKHRNTWNTVTESSKQYQSITYMYTNSSIFNIPVNPAPNEAAIPYIKVYKNSTILPETSWEKIQSTIQITEVLELNDKIDIFIFSNEVGASTSYQIPKNLDLNAQNLTFSSLTLGQLRNHLTELSHNTSNMIGSSVGVNNLRDIPYKQQGGDILQHSAPITYAALFLIDDTSNFINATTLAQQEYNRFKNKFLELSVNMPELHDVDSATAVDLILDNINSFKNSSFPWYYSDMVPFGNNKNLVETVVFDTLVRTYEITKVFNDTELSNTSVLVYLNSDPNAIYIDGTGIDVTNDILGKTAYVTNAGVVLEDDITIRFGSNVTPARYRTNNYRVVGVGFSITLIPVNNNVQLIKGLDYEFDQTRPAITLLDNVALEIDYRITVVEYYNTDGSYIPETPTKLGLYPKFRPEIVVDDTYRVTKNVIIGHDGSRTPVFGDFRDDYLLELERRIYNNIKSTSRLDKFGIYDFIPGKFRNTQYTLAEFDQVLMKSFLSWVGSNALDYSRNNSFLSNDPFTWNFAQLPDQIDGEVLAGNWRAIYKYFFDTDTPHQTPWQMLGFTERPDWWIGYYGPAPYTSSNALLWEHLAAGIIVDGERAGIDARFARPKLLSIIPVDENGYLKHPVAASIASFNSKNATATWTAGTQGPAETAWRRSSDFPYALQIAMALTKPARYFSNFLDTQNYRYDNKINQYVQKTDGQHIKQGGQFVNGKTPSGVINRSAGYINWIADLLTYHGIDPYNKINDIITNFQVKLSYKVGGFTDKTFLKILADQYSPTSTNDSIIIPNENYQVHLNKSCPVQKITYSAVIVEQTTNGYSVRGYDLSNPYFTIIPSIVNGHSTKMTVLNETVTVYFDYQSLMVTIPYNYEFSSSQQLADFLISYERYLIAQGFAFTVIDDTLGEVRDWKLSIKEYLYWKQQGWTAGSIIVLSPVADSINITTSGAIVDEVTDSISGSRVVDQNFGIIRNIDYKIYRTPTLFKIALTNTQIIGLITLNLVQYEHILIFDNLTVFNDVIYKPELGNRQYRLKLIGQKTNNWDGSVSPAGFIYNSDKVNVWESGYDYLKGDLVNFKSQYFVALTNMVASDIFVFANWKQVDYNSIKTGLLPNFATISSKGETYYNPYSEQTDTNRTYFQGGNNSNQSHYGYGLIGFKSRDYLDNLGLTDTTQVELYKGFIKQKGTSSAINALTNARFNSTTGQINFYEEWAVRVGAYGALDINQTIEVQLDEKTFSTNSQVIEFVDIDNAYRANGRDVIGVNNLHRYTGTYTGVIALNRDITSDYTNDMPYAGFVNLNDVDSAIFDLAKFANLNNDIDKMGTGYTIWCAKDFKQNWNVYRVTETNNTVVSISNALDGFISITCIEHHDVKIDDIILIRNFDELFDGFHQIYQIVDLNTIIVKFAGDLSNLTTLDGNGLFFKMSSLRFQYMEDVRLNKPLNGWQVGEKVWIDNVVPSNQWGVFERKQPWQYSESLTKSESEYATNDGYGTALKINDSGTIIAVSSPLNTVNTTDPNDVTVHRGIGIVDIFVKTSINKFSQDSSLSLVPNSSLTLSFGYSLDLTDSIMVVGAPNSESNIGHVYIYYKDATTSRFSLAQIIRGQTGDKIGNTVKLSRDGVWLYIGAIGTGKVYAYKLNSHITSIRMIKTIGRTSRIVLLDSMTPNSVSDVMVYKQSVPLMPSIDYTLSGDKKSLTILADLPEYDIEIEIRQQSIFELVDTISGSIFEEFGYAISASADGAQIAVGAPRANVVVGTNTIVNAGKVYVYDRTIEAFVSAQEQKQFTTTSLIKSSSTITANGITLTPSEYTAVANSHTMTLNNAVLTGSIVTIETNKFNLLQTLIGSNPQPDARHGSSIAICSFNCAIYIGSPQYDVLTGIYNTPSNETIIPVANNGLIVNSGAVFKNHNQGRLYGTIAGSTIKPSVTPGNSIRLNDFEVVFTGISTSTLNGLTVKQLTLSGNITANVGDYITQTTSNANVTIVAATNNIKVISISNYNNANTFAFGSGAGSIAINGVTVTGITPIADLESVVSDINNKQIIGVTAVIEVKIDGDNYNHNAELNQWYTSDGSVITNAELITYLDVNNESPTTLMSDTYTRVSRIWKNSQNISITNAALINLLESRYYLRLTSESKVSRNKMRVLSGVGTAIADLGLDVFYQMQVITSPDNIAGEQFGTSISLEKDAHKLIISSKYGSTIVETVFDAGELTLDDNSTHFRETINSSGAAYLFELYDDPRDSVELPGRYAFTQQFNSGELNLGDQFGQCTDIIGNYVLVSAPNDGTVKTGGGSIYLFENVLSQTGWTQIYKETPKVDIDSISRKYLFNKVKNEIVQNLEIIDPNKGRIIGEAEREITYKTIFDPAIYNKGTQISTTNWWGVNQVYQVWWDISTVRYIDYEQGDLTYRSLNWGKLFPGSSIDIYEWTESSVLPSQYTASGGDGTPLYSDNSAYVETISVNPTSGIISIKYYYWVTNKTTFTGFNAHRKLPTNAIKTLITNPAGEGIQFAAVIQNNALSFYNIQNILTGSDIVLSVTHGVSDNSNIIHSEYALIKNEPNAVIPQSIINKFIDSLSGVNVIGQAVPDPKLNQSDKYGISIRPRQTMFVNRLAALKTAITYVNSILIKYQIIDANWITLLNAEEPTPATFTKQWDLELPTYAALAYYPNQQLTEGYRILVNEDETQNGLWVIYVNKSNTWRVQRVQSYKTTQYWHYADWYAVGYSDTTRIDYIALDNSAALRLPYKHGDIIKILNNGNGKWRLVEVVDADLTATGEALDFHNEFVTVGIQDGALQLNNIADYTSNNLGFSNQTFDTNRYDENPSTETRYLLEAIIQASTVQSSSDEFKSIFTNLLFVMLNYVHTEQPVVDWIFKTSFITVQHQLRSLVQTLNYTNENQTYYEDYINEIKPYKTKIREYVLNYTGNDTFAGSLTDFDLPSYYDATRQVFRSPSGELAQFDANLWQNPTYNDWYKNRTYEIGEVVISHSGTGYTIVPTVTFISSTGSGASAHAVINAETGQITRIVVDNHGSGYSSIVTININGNGVGARAYPIFKQNQIRGISTTIKFDRIGFKSIVTNWAENTKYTSGDIIAFNGAAYKVNPDMNGNITTYNSTNTIDFTKLTHYNANAFAVSSDRISMGANDRIVGYYKPTNDMPVIETSTATIVTANVTVASNIIYVNSLMYIQPGMNISGSNVSNTTITEVVADVVSGINYIRVDRVQSLANSTVLTATYNNLGQLVSGINYPGSYMTGPNFDENPGFDIGPTFGRSLFDPVEYNSDGVPLLGSALLNSIIESNYSDYALGNRPEDINVVGGSFVDDHSSHSPEELIPGMVFDTLDMKVYTKVNDSIIAYRVFNNMLNKNTYLRISSAYSTTLSANLNITDSEIHVLDAKKVPTPDRVLARPGVIYIDNERITYYRNYATEVTQWLPNVTFVTDSILSYGNAVTFGGNISAKPGDYIIQESTGANAFVTVSAINQSKLLMYYLNSNVFAFGTGNVTIVSGSGTTIGNVTTTNVHPISSNMAYYKTTDTILSTNFSFNKVTPIDNINILSQIRRSTGGTGGKLTHVVGSTIYDGSDLQLVPNTSLTTTTITSTQHYHVADELSYVLNVDGLITANVGDFLTQSISSANVFVSHKVVNSNVIYVTSSSTNKFAYGNVVTDYRLEVNGTQSTVCPMSMDMNGNNLDEHGNITVLANTILTTDTIWHTPGVGLGQGTINSWTEQEKFLWNSPYQQ